MKLKCCSFGCSLFWLLTLFFSGLASAAQYNIGVILADLSNPFFDKLGKSLIQESKNQFDGSVQVTILSSAYDLVRQQNQIDQLIQQGVDLIVITAANTEAIGQDILRARSHGIVVTAVDISAKGADVTVTSDNVQAGHEACMALLQRMQPGDQLAIIHGADISSVNDRVNGCKQAYVEADNGVTLVDTVNGGGTYEGGLEAMTILMSKYPQLDAVFAINDPSALGALSALEFNQNQSVMMASVDGSKLAVEEMTGGNSHLLTTAAQNPEKMAKIAIELSLKKLRGEISEPVDVKIPVWLITAPGY